MAVLSSCQKSIQQGITIDENGETGNITTSGYFGEPLTGETINALVEKPIEVVMDENGLLSWEAPEYIRSYMVRIEDVNEQILSESYIGETTFQLPEGYCAMVTGQYINGSAGPENRTEFFGHPAALADAISDVPPAAVGKVQELTLIDAVPATEADAQALCVELNMDETGLVTWLPVENAEADKLEIDKNGSMNMKTLYIQDTSFRLLEHYSLNVYPLFADGTEGISMRSAVFGGLAEEVSPLDHSAYQVYGLIPAIDPASFVTAKDGTPFNEYIIIDLFTAEGLHQYDAPRCELDGAKGVRIYHVNSAMERRELTYELAGDTVFPIGTIHIANEYKEPDRGQYLIELILRGGDNTFTDTSNVKKLRTNLLPKDLFTAGDVFTAEKYDEFFYEGKMDDGLPFGYTVKVVSIETTAVISVTRQN